jgi:hypothetical protein
VFVAWENIGSTLRWPSLKAKIGEMKKSKFGSIVNRSQFYQHFNPAFAPVFFLCNIILLKNDCIIGIFFLISPV